ncbi:MAG: hypothetical protein J0I12_06560 [Candidatus Eremiobacteraeota bacterium]|nr:hypothetical protein [Candidatus Eremiobacteraeota bacterium]
MESDERDFSRLLNRVASAVFGLGLTVVLLISGNHLLALKKEVKAELISQQVKTYVHSRTLILKFRSEEGLIYQASVPVSAQAKLGPLTGPLELRVYHGIFASGVDEIRSGGHVFKV